MTHQLGPGFANYFLIPRMKQIFDAKNIENDDRLQVLLSFKDVLKPEQIKGLKEDYFSDWTGTVMDDQANKDIFWNMLITYVGYIKQVSKNPETLASMFLPGEKGLSKEAANRYSFFCFLFNKTLEKKFIEEEIAKQNISDTEKNNLHDLNKKEELILVRKKGEGSPFGIVSKDQIEKAQQSEGARNELMAELFTQPGPEGGTQVILMNPSQEEGEKAQPGREQGSSLIGMIKSVWENIFRQVREIFKEAKLDITGKVSIDSAGVIKFYVTKGRTKLLVEYSAAKPIGPDGRNYKFTFVDQPTKNFWATDKDIDNYFVRQNLSPEQVHQIKVSGEPKTAGVTPPTGAPLPTGGGAPQPGIPGRRVAAATHAPSEPKMPIRTALPAITPTQITPKGEGRLEGEAMGRGKIPQKKQRLASRRGGVMGAKRSYQEGRMGAEGAKTKEKGKGEVRPENERVPVARHRQGRKKSSPLKWIAIITGSTGAAALGGSAITVFFT